LPSIWPQAGFAPEVTADITKLGRNATDLFTLTEAGDIQAMHFAASYLAHRVPALEVFDLPFRYNGREGLLGALDGALGDRLKAEIAANTGYHVLGFWDNGARHMTNKHRPVKVPADCAGLKIRTMNSALHQATFAALGMTPMYIDVKDYPGAVRDGIVDAQENPHTNTLNFGIPAHHPFLTPTGHFQGVSLFLCNRAWAEALPPEARAAFLDAAAKATAAQRGFAVAEDTEALDRILAQGTALTHRLGQSRLCRRRGPGPGRGRGADRSRHPRPPARLSSRPKNQAAREAACISEISAKAEFDRGRFTGSLRSADRSAPR
jgi:TRAP-type transport system periplasmic protein